MQSLPKLHELFIYEQRHTIWGGIMSKLSILVTLWAVIDAQQFQDYSGLKHFLTWYCWQVSYPGTVQLKYCCSMLTPLRGWSQWQILLLLLLSRIMPEAYILVMCLETLSLLLNVCNGTQMYTHNVPRQYNLCRSTKQKNTIGKLGIRNISL